MNDTTMWIIIIGSAFAVVLACCSLIAILLASTAMNAELAAQELEEARVKAHKEAASIRSERNEVSARRSRPTRRELALAPRMSA